MECCHYYFVRGKNQGKRCIVKPRSGTFCSTHKKGSTATTATTASTASTATTICLHMYDKGTLCRSKSVNNSAFCKRHILIYTDVNQLNLSNRQSQLPETKSDQIKMAGHTKQPANFSPGKYWEPGKVDIVEFTRQPVNMSSRDHWESNRFKLFGFKLQPANFSPR
jgi:hypothetical protein